MLSILSRRNFSVWEGEKGGGGSGELRMSSIVCFRDWVTPKISAYIYDYL